MTWLELSNIVLKGCNNCFRLSTCREWIRSRSEACRTNPKFVVITFECGMTKRVSTKLIKEYVQ